MRLSQTIFGFSVISIFAIHSTFGQTYSDDLLLESAGARAVMTAGSHVANVNDSYAPLWNAAGLGQLNKPRQGALMYASGLGSAFNQMMVNGAYQIDSSSALGIGWSRVVTDNSIDSRKLFPGSDPIFENVNTFSSNNQLFYLSWGSRLSKVPGLSIGATLRMHYGEVQTFSTMMGFGLDIGAQYRKSDWRFGANLKGVFGDYRHWSYNTSQLAETFAQTGIRIFENRLETYRPRLVLGASRLIKLGEKVAILPTFDVAVSADNRSNGLLNTGSVSIAPKMGVMLELFQKIQIGGGISQLAQQEQVFSKNKELSFAPHAGCGVRFKKLNFNYAWMRNILADESFSSHFFTLTFAY